jgi:hypothetical protein
MELPSEDALRFLVSSYARVRADLGELLEEPPLVLPTGEFFPDEFDKTPEGVANVMLRVKSYTPLSDDLPVDLAFTEPDEQAGGGGCGTGGCAPGAGPKDVARGGAIETDRGYAVVVDVRDVAEPSLLVASLARSAAGIVLAEGEVDLPEGDVPAASEVLATAMGFGVILAQGACVYKKGCGGMRMHRGTHLGVDEHAVLLALFTRVEGKKPSAARSHLDTTQAEAFDEALKWVDSNHELVERLRDDPELLVDGLFEMKKSAGLLGRIFGKKKSPRPDDAPAPSARTQRSEAEQRRLDEARRLVEEALAEE